MTALIVVLTHILTVQTTRRNDFIHLQREVSVMAASLRHVDDVVRIVRQEPLERAQGLAAHSERIAACELRLGILDQRMATMSQRILAINQRLDKATPEAP